MHLFKDTTAVEKNPLMMGSSKGRKRSRRSMFARAAVSATGAALLLFGDSVEAFSTSITSKTKCREGLTLTLQARSTRQRNSLSLVEEDVLQRNEFSLSSPRVKSFYSYDTDYNTVDDDDEEDEDVFVEAYVPAFQQLKRSTGSEILPSDVQKKIDEGATSFLNGLVEDASEVEKVAMRSITEQLPQAALQALSNGKTRAASKSTMNFAKERRVTPEQEIQLAKIIQQGAALHKIRTDALLQGKELTRQEWADLAGVTTKELRRNVSDYRKAKHHLVTANLGLVHAVVNQVWPSLYAKTGISKEEMVQEGSLGLLRAAELFDPERGLRFSTYAVVWIKGILSNSHLPELVKLPAREKIKWNKIMKAQKDILAMNIHRDDADGPAATNALRVPVEQIAAATGLTVAEIVSTQRRMQQAQRVYSLDYEIQTQSRSGVEDGTANTVASKVKDDNDKDLAEFTQLKADLLAAMARNLDGREGRLMRLRYGLSDGRPRSLHECAEAMGLSYTRVHQLAQRCLQKLREAVEAESLEEYLLTIA